MYAALVEKGHVFEQAEVAAAAAVNDTDYAMREAGFSLFDKLFAQGQAYDKAVNASKSALMSTNFYTQHRGFELIENIFNNKRRIERSKFESVVLRIKDGLPYFSRFDTYYQKKIRELISSYEQEEEPEYLYRWRMLANPEAENY